VANVKIYYYLAWRWWARMRKLLSWVSDLCLD
jgi:hypothetical protein